MAWDNRIGLVVVKGSGKGSLALLEMNDASSHSCDRAEMGMATAGVAHSFSPVKVFLDAKVKDNVGGSQKGLGRS